MLGPGQEQARNKSDGSSGSVILTISVTCQHAMQPETCHVYTVWVRGTKPGKAAR